MPSESPWAKLKSIFSGSQSKKDKVKEAEERLEEFLDEVQDEGLIDEEAGEMFLGVIDLLTTEADEIMVPRIGIDAVSEDTSIPEIIHTILTSGHSRIPVYKENVDHIVGFVYAKDLLRYWGRENGDVNLTDILREPYFVPESKPVGDLLREFQKKKVQIAVVVDEYGGTSGLVSIEDIVEEIVGEIEDEYDPEQAEPQIVQNDNWVEAAAGVDIDDLFDIFDCEAPEGDFTTIGGWIFHGIGRIPNQSETIELGAYEIKILDADERQINRVAIKKLEVSQDQDS